MDVSSAVSQVGDVAVAAGVIGLAVLVMLIGIKSYKWIASSGGGGAPSSNSTFSNNPDDVPFD
jgi:hypothetical protein